MEETVVMPATHTQVMQKYTIHGLAYGLVSVSSAEAPSSSGFIAATGYKRSIVVLRERSYPPRQFMFTFDTLPDERSLSELETNAIVMALEALADQKERVVTEQTQQNGFYHVESCHTDISLR